MYYCIGYDSPEDSDKIILFHEKDYTQLEFEELIINTAIEVVKERKNDYIHGFNDIYSWIADRLVMHNGFVPLHMTSFIVFGWPSIFDKKDWDGHRNPLLNKLTDKLNECGFNKEYENLLGGSENED